MFASHKWVGACRDGIATQTSSERVAATRDVGDPVFTYSVPPLAVGEAAAPLPIA